MDLGVEDLLLREIGQVMVGHVLWVLEGWEGFGGVKNR